MRACVFGSHSPCDIAARTCCFIKIFPRRASSPRSNFPAFLRQKSSGLALQEILEYYYSYCMSHEQCIKSGESGTITCLCTLHACALEPMRINKLDRHWTWYRDSVGSSLQLCSYHRLDIRHMWSARPSMLWTVCVKKQQHAFKRIWSADVAMSKRTDGK